MVTEKGKTLEKVQENGKHKITKTEQCMEEVQAILDKYKCEIVCLPQKMYGQTIYAPMISEIKP